MPDLSGTRLEALVVDNNPVLLRAVAAFLEREGCGVRCAANGLEALTLVRQVRPDILFTDLVMPLVGGEQLCKILRNTPEFSQIFLVVVSGIVLEDLQNIISARYYDFCIAKGPLKELKCHISEALERYRQRKKGDVPREKDVAKIPEGLMASSVAMELLSEQRHVYEIFESVHEGVIVLDRERRMVNVNGAVEKILGVCKEKLIGLDFLSLPWSDNRERLADWLSRRRREGGAEMLEIDDEEPIHVNDRVVSLSLTPVRQQQSGFSICILRDITRQYLAEEHQHALAEAMTMIRKMETLSSMAGGVAHDFSNLLTVICGNLEIVLAMGTLPEKSAELLRNARSAAMKAVELTRKISHSSPFGIVSRVQLPLEELVRDAVAGFFAGSQTEYRFQAAVEEEMVNVDPVQIQTAISNVLQNCVEAGGTEPIEITVCKRHIDVPEVVRGQYVPAGKYGAIEIRDHGCGIAREDALSIFDPYYSTKRKGEIKGMGLGLTVVYATMRNHGGYIVVDSEPGRGTSMLLLLPLYEGVPGRSTQEKKVYRVLLVERDPQALEICRIMLEYMDYEVVVAATVEEALSAVRQGLLPGGVPFHVLFIDPAQQGQSDYRQLFGVFKDLDPRLNLVVTGGSALNPKMDNYKQCGCGNVLPHPYTHDSLKLVLATAGCC